MSTNPDEDIPDEDTADEDTPREGTAEPAGARADGPAVLDASAVLAWLQNEPGADVVQAHIEGTAGEAVNYEGAVIGAVNLAEVHQKLTQHGVDADRTTRLLLALGVRVEPLGADDAIAASRLWSATRSAGLSLGDRCCLALAARLAGPAITADTAWSALEVGVTVVPIR